MSKEIAVVIPLKVWQDPQGDLVLHSSERDCTVYFGCWEAAGEPADYICKLTFESAWAIRGTHSEYLPYARAAHQHRSYIYEINFSAWLQEESKRRSEDYPEWKQWDNRIYHHYVITGHNLYYEIIAESFSEHIVLLDEAGELARLSDLA